MSFLPPLSSTSDGWIGRRISLERSLVCAQDGLLPVALALPDGRLAVLLRTGGPHLSIHGTLSLVESADGGRSWSRPLELLPGGMDYRNPALGLNQQGELLVACWAAGLHAYDQKEHGMEWSLQNRAAWQRPALVTLIRAGDSVWSEPRFSSSRLLDLASPYGRIAGAGGGRLAMNLYGNARHNPQGARNTAILCFSEDGGRTWPEERLIGYGLSETALLPLQEAGAWLAVARRDDGCLLPLRSKDDGQTWQAAPPLTRPGEHPADLTRLHNGDIVLSFGRRIRPYGCAAWLSRDEGRTWLSDQEILLAGDGLENADLGYPSTVEVMPGKLVTLLYYACGSGMTRAFQGWGHASCQAIHWSAALWEV
jgi:hypothetical protein